MLPSAEFDADHDGPHFAELIHCARMGKLGFILLSAHVYSGMFISNDWKLQHITNCASMIGFMLLMAHMKAGIISHLKIYAFCVKSSIIETDS